MTAIEVVPVGYERYGSLLYPRKFSYSLLEPFWRYRAMNTDCSRFNSAQLYQFVIFVFLNPEQL